MHAGMQTILLTLISLLAFAANSILCRLALAGEHIAPAEFTAIRLASGALVLWFLCLLSPGKSQPQGNVAGAVALFTYAACFSFAYVNLNTGVGALLLFGAVQLTMIGMGVVNGERLSVRQWSGVVIAVTGLFVLTSPGLHAPDLLHGGLMMMAGIAWGIYSLLGRKIADPLALTAGNFVWTMPLAAGLVLFAGWPFKTDMSGVIVASASGAVASGMGYALWYKVLPSLRASTAATVQLCVPLLASYAGWLLLDERIGMRMIIASATILGGIALVMHQRRKA